MFAKATRKLVDEIDPNGSLIPVSRLNESDNLTVFSLVIKRKPCWFWQQPKYIPTDFTLNDLLIGEKINPVLTENDFLKYNNTVKSDAAGGVEAGIGPGGMNIEGKSLFKLATSFGSLKKQEVDVQSLLHDFKDRQLDFRHCLLKQILQRRREVFALVKERIITTEICEVAEEVQGGGSCSAFFGLTVPKTIQVSVKNGGLNLDHNVFLEIPARTVLAYSLMELTVKRKGQFELCLLPDTSGCFEVDGLKKTDANLVCSTPLESPVQKLQEEMDGLQVHFKVLSGLPASTRSYLFQQITSLLRDKAAISTLNLALEDLFSDRKSDLSTLDKAPSLNKAVQTILELLKEEESTDHDPREGVPDEWQLKPSAITATSILTSALEEMTEPALKTLKSCCHCPILQAMHLLVENVMGNKECSLKDSTLATLADKDTYSKVQELFGNYSVMLSKNEDLIQAQITNQQEHFPLILCIALFGLASLASPTFSS
ncbi:gasdermin Eb [Neoarius graeffei]|uniref:gasdermin Eb n=1 Tax=Neoarius graeffei TaxID=443677 RepID=UPI00298C8D4A|nr:gasdermin Eb [Neoarius graeffei]